MDLKSARRLKRGDVIFYGNSMWTEKVDAWRKGVVVSVTERGGIRVRNNSGHGEWVPYHHVNQSMRESVF